MHNTTLHKLTPKLFRTASDSFGETSGFSRPLTADVELERLLPPLFSRVFCDIDFRIDEG